MCHDPNKNHRVSLVALMTSCVTRADERLRVFSHSLPCRGERCGLPACTRLGQDPTGTKFRSSCRSPPRGYPRSIHPHYLSVYASTSHFEDVASITASRRLIDSLQHSIRSLWLRATPAGITPACHQTISSPHVHGYVILDHRRLLLPFPRRRVLLLSRDRLSVTLSNLDIGYVGESPTLREQCRPLSAVRRQGEIHRLN